MDKNTIIIILYDIYNSLLTDNQKKYFEDYYFDNMSLGEISEKHNISRSGVQKNIKSIEKLLNDYESKLKLYSKNKQLDKIISEIEDIDIKNILIEYNKR